MKPEMVDALLMWGDRSNRDTAHLLDIAVAGTIEQTIGHGTVILRPARLEEIVSRIGPRERDPDGGWKVTLLPSADEPNGHGPSEDTYIAIAQLAERILAVEELPGENRECVTAARYNVLLADAKRIAGAALLYRDPRDSLPHYENPDGN